MRPFGHVHVGGVQIHHPPAQVRSAECGVRNPEPSVPAAAEVPRQTSPTPSDEPPPKPKKKRNRNWGTRMKLHGHNQALLLFLIFNFTFLISSLADLTATVSPGYTFSANERPTVSALNRLGTPTITISGTLSGTNAGITAGSINGSMLAASVVDNDTINFTNSSPQAIAIKAEGVKARELNRAVAGDGLLGGAGTNLSVNIDSNSLAVATIGYTLRCTNDVLTLATNLSVRLLSATANTVIVGGPGNAGTNLPAIQFMRMLYTNSTAVLGDYSLAAGSVANAAHNLGYTPTYVRWVYVCVTTEAGYAVGDEISVQAVEDTSGGSRVAFGANSTNVFLTLYDSIGSTLRLYNKSTGALSAFTLGNWRARCYASP